MNEPHPIEKVCVLWALHRAANEARAEVWTHPMGLELRRFVDGSWVSGELCRSPEQLEGIAAEWKTDLLARGWKPEEHQSS